MANTSIGWRAASSKRLVGEVAGSRGGSRVETLPDHEKCYFVGLLGCMPLTAGICDDVLDVVEGIAGETVIELMQDKKGIMERYGSDKKMYREIVKKQSPNDSASQWTSLMTVSTHQPHQENASLLTSPKRFQMT